MQEALKIMKSGDYHAPEVKREEVTIVGKSILGWRGGIM